MSCLSDSKDKSVLMRLCHTEKKLSLTEKKREFFLEIRKFFVRQRGNFVAKRATIVQLISSAGVFDKMSKIFDKMSKKLPIPSRESHVKPLLQFAFAFTGNGQNFSQKGKKQEFVHVT